MSKITIPLLFFPDSKRVLLLKNYLYPLISFVSNIGPLKYDLISINHEQSLEDYSLHAIFSAFIWGLFSFLFSLSFMLFRSFKEDKAILSSFVIGVIFFIILLMLHVIYPGIIAKKLGQRSERDLLYALRDMLLQIESGISLYDSMYNISISGYGYLSKEFEQPIKMMNSGISEREALLYISIHSKSEYLRKITWQIITSLESGASLTVALRSTMAALENSQARAIRSYSSNLNMLMLVYMLAAAAIPSLGVTFLTILSAFSGSGIGNQTFLFLFMFSAIVQLVLIGYIQVSRPNIYD